MKYYLEAFEVEIRWGWHIYHYDEASNKKIVDAAFEWARVTSEQAIDEGVECAEKMGIDVEIVF